MRCERRTCCTCTGFRPLSVKPGLLGLTTMRTMRGCNKGDLKSWLDDADTYVSHRVLLARLDFANIRHREEADTAIGIDALAPPVCALHKHQDHLVLAMLSNGSRDS